MNHGDHPNCGREYETDESTVTAFCPHCKHRFEECLETYPRETIVRHTASCLRSLYGNGGRGAPINGRIVGAAGRFPIVQWSNGETGPIAESGIEIVQRLNAPRTVRKVAL